MTQPRTKAFPPRGEMISFLRELYERDTPIGRRFRYALLVFDVFTVAFIVATSFLPRTQLVEMLDVAFGVVILADIIARMASSRHRMRDLMHPATWADLIAVASFLAPVAGEAAGFCACCARCVCCTRIICWSGCGRTFRSSAATKTPSSP